MRYRFLEDIAIADVAFEAYGKTLNELFENCALALTAVMVDTKTIKSISNLKSQIPASPAGGSNLKIEDLLFDFLSELVYLKDAKQLLFSKFKVKIRKVDAEDWRLEADLWGESIDPQRHKLRADVKAVTWHLFKMEKSQGNWLARVVLDI